jgi:hypothetical protein
MRSPKRQRGITSVELAIVGLLFFIVMFAVLEVGRLFFVLNSLDEATRRGARMAAVCQVNDAAITQVAVFNQSGDASASSLVAGLEPADIQIRYLDVNGSPVGLPATDDFEDVRYVEASVVGFQHQLIIPTRFTTFILPDFRTTLPRESLGVSRDGFTPC